MEQMTMDGFACTLFLGEDGVIWLTGLDECKCECYTPIIKTPTQHKP